MTSEQLKEARRELGLTQVELGLELNLTREMIGLMERDRKRIDRRTELAVQHLFCMKKERGNHEQ